MKKLWLLVVVLACFSNAISISWEWYHQQPADWFVWGSAILFAISIGAEAVSDLAGE